MEINNPFKAYFEKRAAHKELRERERERQMATSIALGAILVRSELFEAHQKDEFLRRARRDVLRDSTQAMERDIREVTSPTPPQE